MLNLRFFTIFATLVFITLNSASADEENSSIALSPRKAAEIITNGNLLRMKWEVHVVPSDPVKQAEEREDNGKISCEDPRVTERLFYLTKGENAKLPDNVDERIEMILAGSNLEDKNEENELLKKDPLHMKIEEQLVMLESRRSALQSQIDVPSSDQVNVESAKLKARESLRQLESDVALLKSCLPQGDLGSTAKK